MTFRGLQVFDWPIDWASPVNGEWSFDLREVLLGFGPELTDIKQSHVVHGWEFTTDFRDDQIDDIETFLDALKGRSRPFWMPGPSARFRIEDGNAANSFVIYEQGAATSWQLHPGGYLWFTKPGDAPQIAKITGIVDNGDGTETVTFEQVQSAHESSSSSVNSSSSSSSRSRSSVSSSSSTVASNTSSSESSQSSVNSSSSGHSSSSSEGESSSSSIYPESESSSSAFVTVDEEWEVFPLFLVRLADDVERIEIFADTWQRRSFKVVELPHDYALVDQSGEPAESAEPVYLYRFTATFPTETVTWRFTSYPSDVTMQNGNLQSSSSSSSSESESQSSASSKSSVSESSSLNSSSSTNNSSSSTAVSESSSSTSDSSYSSSSSSSSTNSSSSDGPTTTWLAVGIEHSRLSRTAKLGGTVTISADIDNVEPLRLLVPMRLAVPLKVEILRTNTNWTEAEVVFVGVVRKPDLQGRKVSVQCVEWGEVMDQKVPNFYIQRNCNYRVYDANTCRASQSAKEIDVSVIAKASRTITIEDSGLAGLAENWFAGGWIELGEGLEREVYYVMSSTAAFGNRVILTLSAAFAAEVPASGTVVPGCDGRRSTCVSKFDNLVNFGGHATPRDNLTLVAIKTNQRGGKK